MAFMKSVVEVTNAIKSIKDLEEFQFTHKSALTSLIVVSGAGIPSGQSSPVPGGLESSSLIVPWLRFLGDAYEISLGAVKPSCPTLDLPCWTIGSENNFGIS